jgi:hypothetical protein
VQLEQLVLPALLEQLVPQVLLGLEGKLVLLVLEQLVLLVPMEQLVPQVLLGLLVLG